MDNQIIAETDPGSITGSYGNYFYNHMNKEKKYIVVNYASTDSFFSSSSSFLFIKHDFSLVKLNNKL